MGRADHTASSSLSAGAKGVKRRKRHRRYKESNNKSKKIEAGSKVVHASISHGSDVNARADHSASSSLSGGAEGVKRKRHGRDKESNNKSKKIKVGSKVMHASIGHGSNISARHIMQLRGLSALMSIKERSFENTNDMDQVLKRPGCSNGLYLKWDKKEDRYFLWGSTAEAKIMIKFEFHGGFEENTDELDAKHPLLVFSEGFDHSNGWREVKQLFHELFGHSDKPANDEDHDFLFAFTRNGELFHFRIFKILTKLAPVMESMKLEEVSPSFILKPLEICRQDEDSTLDSLTETFMNEDKFMLESKCNLDLVSDTVFCDSSYHFMVPHSMKPILDHIVMLPLPSQNLQWLGFNTSCKEFFERYLVYRTTLVPGTGQDPRGLNPSPDDPTAAAATPVYYDHISLPTKVFSRSLILAVKETHIYGCLSDFDERNIFVRKGRIVILGVKLLPYSTELAKANFIRVHEIIMRVLQGMRMPRDVYDTLDRLETDPLGNYDIVANSFSWMEDMERHHMVAALNEDFTELLPDLQVKITKTLPGMATWLDKFTSNRLLYDVLTDKAGKSHAHRRESLEAYFKTKAGDLQRKAKRDNNKLDMLISPGPDDHFQLFNGRKYFKGIRNSYVHLPGTAVKFGLEPLSSAMVDLVVSSEFDGTCSAVDPSFFLSKNGRQAQRAQRSSQRLRSMLANVTEVPPQKLIRRRAQPAQVQKTGLRKQKQN